MQHANEKRLNGKASLEILTVFSAFKHKYDSTKTVDSNKVNVHY